MARQSTGEVRDARSGSLTVTPDPASATRADRSGGLTVTRHGLLAIGWIALAIGAVGLVVPLLPTTVFWIVAVWCFGKSCPERAKRLYAHPKFGRVLSDFVQHGVIAPPAKRAAIFGIALAFAVAVLVTGLRWGWLAGVGAILAAVVLYIATRPEAANETASPPPSSDQRSMTSLRVPVKSPTRSCTK